MPKHLYNYGTNLFVLLITLFISSCSNNMEFIDYDVESDFVRFNYNFASYTQSTIASAEENIIEDALFVFYTEAGEYVDYVSVDDVNKITTTIDVELPRTLDKNQSYQVFVAANLKNYISAGDYDQLVKENTNLSFDEISYRIAATLTSNDRIVTPLPFTGRLIDTNEDDILLKPSQFAQNTPLIIRFTRAVARIDLNNHTVGNSENSLDIIWAKVSNYRDSGLIDVDMPIGNVIAKADPEGVIPKGCVQLNESQIVKGGLYAFSNRVQFIEQKDKETTCILIYGSFNGRKPSYYRINIGQNGAIQYLKRNYIYTITITNVTKNGSDTEEEALYVDDSGLTYELADKWENSHEIEVDDKGNYLRVFSDYVILHGQKNAREDVTVYTLPNGKWSAKIIDEPNNQFCEIVEITPTSFGIRATKDNLGDLRINNILLTLEGSNLTQEVTVAQKTKCEAELYPANIIVDFLTPNYSNMYFSPVEGVHTRFVIYSGERWRVRMDDDLKRFAEFENPDKLEGNSGDFLYVLVHPNGTRYRRGGLLIFELINSKTNEVIGVRKLEIRQDIKW